VFHYDYSDLQVAETIGTAQIIENAGKAKIYGAELDLSLRPNERWDLRWAGSYLNATYDKYVGFSGLRPFLPSVDFSGHRLNNSPKFSGYFSVAYHLPVAKGEMTLRAEANYSTRYYFTPDNVDLLSQKASLKENLFATYKMDSGWSVDVYVRNLTNETTRTQALVTTPSVAQVVTGSFAPPRTFGAELRYDF